MIQTFKECGIKYNMPPFFQSSLNFHFVSRLPSFSVEVNTSIPIGAGLGSSASYCVCLSTTLLAATGRISLSSASGNVSPSPALSATEGEINVSLSAQDLELICKWSLEGEKLVHGKPSGIDNSVCTYGKYKF